MIAALSLLRGFPRLKLIARFTSLDASYMARLLATDANTPAEEVLDLLVEQPKSDVKRCLKALFIKLKLKQLNPQILSHETFAELCVGSRVLYIDFLLSHIDGIFDEKMSYKSIEKIMAAYAEALDQSNQIDGRDQMRQKVRVNVHMFRTMCYKLKGYVDFIRVGCPSCEEAIEGLFEILSWQEEQHTRPRITDNSNSKIAAQKQTIASQLFTQSAEMQQRINELIKEKSTNISQQNIDAIIEEITYYRASFDEDSSAKEQAAEAAVAYSKMILYQIARGEMKKKLLNQDKLKYTIDENEIDLFESQKQRELALARIEKVIKLFSKEDKAYSNWYHELIILFADLEGQIRKETSLKPEKIKENIYRKIEQIQTFIDESKKDLSMKAKRIRTNERMLCKTILEARIRQWKLAETLKTPENDVMQEMVKEGVSLINIFHDSVGRIVDPKKDQELKLYISKVLARQLPPLKIIELHVKSRI